MRPPIATLCLLALTALASAQTPCGTTGVIVTVMPAVATPGQPITVTLTNNSTGPIDLPSPCLFMSVFPGGSCSGAGVYNVSCPGVIVQIPAGQSYSQPWNQRNDAGQQVPNGIYSFDIYFFDVTGNLVTCCPTVTIAGQGCTGPGVPYCVSTPNSTGSGAWICATGSADPADNNLTLSAAGLPPGRFGYFLASQTQGYATSPITQGVLCLAGNIGRFNAPGQIIQGPVGSIAIDLGSIPVNPPAAVLPGDTWYFQCWYRDVNPGPTNNFTNGTRVMFL